MNQRITKNIPLLRQTIAQDVIKIVLSN